MKSHILKLDKKVKDIASYEFINSIDDLPSAYDTVDELSAEEFLKNKVDNEKILSDRIKVLEEELQRAREDSFQAGYQEGKAQGTQEAKKQNDELKILIKSFEEQYAKALSNMEIPFQSILLIPF